jgi:predicted nuclease of predicted toxin-antitoxin system
MKFKLDENLPLEAMGVFQSAGFDTTSVLGQELGGEPDRKIAAVCRKEQRILVTLDLDFADIRTYPPSHSSGIIVLRLAKQSKLDVLALMKRLVTTLQTTPCQKQLWIVEQNRIRIRD